MADSLRSVQDPEKKPVPSEIENTVKGWRAQAQMLRVVHVFLLVSASIFSILTASDLYADWKTHFAVAAALSVGILSALDLGVKANGFRNAWRHMNAALARYHTNPRFTAEHLIRAYEAAETLIGDLPSGPRPEIPSGRRSEDRDSRSVQRPEERNIHAIARPEDRNAAIVG
jgi:hypothetical protein